MSYTNAGPGWVLVEQGAPTYQVEVTLPAGTRPVHVPAPCDPTEKAGRYRCAHGGWVTAGFKADLTFTLKVDKLVPGARGTVALTGEPRPFDKNAANDTAEIVVEAADGTSGGGSATGGSATGGSGANGGNGGS
ncbi:hypothetical protein J7E88_17760 [Streptomyces sp. ISL-10]|uniref:hypothetical protein n=1 Tax=Streptomyces sp. ISL-10 TaxID=2819172 RepID=UPI001BE68A3F|nr:hypothetical protein [Streptomyces sp. ISL-10]MBT2367102.1 hypothetical protein [Streptomyces sp. ISL-10]